MKTKLTLERLGTRVLPSITTQVVVFERGGVPVEVAVQVTGNGANDAVLVQRVGTSACVLVNGKNFNLQKYHLPFSVRVDSGPGDDIVIIRGELRSYVEAGTGNDILCGGSGNDSLNGGAGDDWISGGAGNDWLGDLAGQNTLYGGDGDDLILAGDDPDVIYGGAGSDTIFGNGGSDTLYGGEGFDWLFGGEGVDWKWTGNPDGYEYTDREPGDYVDGVLTVV